MTTIAVTGSAGFIGSNLVDELLARGYRVIGIDDLSMGRAENFQHLVGHPDFAFHRLDVLDLPTLRAACQQAGLLIHLAASKIPRYGGAIKTLLVNSKGAEHVLEIARERHIKVIMASTSDVYGKNSALPFAEGDDSVLGATTVPRWSYAVSKLFEEHLALAYREAYGMEVVILRFFGSYGPRQHRSWWGGPQAVFIEAILEDTEMEIHGDGLQTRSFTYISDTVQGIIRAIDCREAVGEIFNIGSQFEISILDLARLIHRLAGGHGEPRLRFIPYARIGKAPYEDVRRRVPDVTKANALLGLSCTVPLEEGLLKTIEWQRAEASAHKLINQAR
jgi:UDP-glucose 4-epimerase